MPTGHFQFTLKAFTRQYPKVTDRKFSNLDKELKDETNRTVDTTSQSKGCAAITITAALPTLSAYTHTLIVGAVREAIKNE